MIFAWSWGEVGWAFWGVMSLLCTWSRRRCFSPPSNKVRHISRCYTSWRCKDTVQCLPDSDESYLLRIVERWPLCNLLVSVSQLSFQNKCLCEGPSIENHRGIELKVIISIDDVVDVDIWELLMEIFGFTFCSREGNMLESHLSRQVHRGLTNLWHFPEWSRSWFSNGTPLHFGEVNGMGCCASNQFWAERASSSSSEQRVVASESSMSAEVLLCVWSQCLWERDAGTWGSVTAMFHGLLRIGVKHRPRQRSSRRLRIVDSNSLASELVSRCYCWLDRSYLIYQGSSGRRIAVHLLLT